MAGAPKTSISPMLSVPTRREDDEQQSFNEMAESRKAPRYALRCRAEISDWGSTNLLSVM